MRAHVNKNLKEEMLRKRCASKKSWGYGLQRNDGLVIIRLFRSQYDIKLPTQISIILGIEGCFACDICF